MRTPQETRAALASLVFDIAPGDTVQPPWTVATEDGVWMVGTDGRLMVAARMAIVDGGAPVAPKRYLATLHKLIVASHDSAVTIPTARLAEFVGCNEAPVDCDECKNTGIVTCTECDGDSETTCECRACGHEHAAECDNCEDGKMDCDGCAAQRAPRPVQILGGIVDARRLRTALRIAAIDGGDLSLALDRESYSILSADGNWRIALMGMRNQTPVATLEIPDSAGVPVTGRAVQFRACDVG